MKSAEIKGLHHVQTFKSEPQEFGVLEDAVRGNMLEGFHQVQHRASGCWMPFWLAALAQASQGICRVPVELFLECLAVPPLLFFFDMHGWIL